MGKPLAIEKKQAIERAYVNEGVTSPTRLAERFGTSVPTVRKIIAAQSLEKKRSDFVATPSELTDRLKKLIHRMLDEFDEKIANKEFIAESKVKELESIVRTLHRIDGMWSSKGALILFANDFVDFVAAQPSQKKLLKQLHALLPQYLEHVESL